MGRTVALDPRPGEHRGRHQTGVAKYAPILFSVHMAQHMVLNMLTPIFLVWARR